MRKYGFVCKVLNSPSNSKWARLTQRQRRNSILLQYICQKQPNLTLNRGREMANQWQTPKNVPKVTEMSTKSQNPSTKWSQCKKNERTKTYPEPRVVFVAGIVPDNTRWRTFTAEGVSRKIQIPRAVHISILRSQPGHQRAIGEISAFQATVLFLSYSQWSRHKSPALEWRKASLCSSKQRHTSNLHAC